MGYEKQLDDNALFGMILSMSEVNLSSLIERLCQNKVINYKEIFVGYLKEHLENLNKLIKEWDIRKEKSNNDRTGIGNSKDKS